MKNTSLIYILFIQMLFCSCGSNYIKPYSLNLPIRNKHFLDGLKKIEAGNTDPMPIDTKKNPILFYTRDGILIPQIVIAKQHTNSGDYTLQGLYVDKNNILKLVVVAPISEEIKKLRKEIDDSKGKPNPLLGKDAIPFTAKDMDGNEFTRDAKGKIIVMNFWFIGCAPCVKEIPELNKLVKKYKNEKVIFLGFTTDKKEKLTPFLEKHPFGYHIIPESIKISDNYKVLACPTHVIIDKNSKINYYYTGGFDSTTIKDFEREIDKVLAN